MTGTLFWRKWLEARDPMRANVVETLPMFKNNPELKDRFVGVINSYFEDLYNFTLNKVRKDLVTEIRKARDEGRITQESLNTMWEIMK